MSYAGDVNLSSNVDIKFTTVAADGTPTALLGTPVVSAYPANSTTQLTAGITLTVNFDSVTGLNHVRVVASGANGYATATDYTLVITTGTVDGVSVVGYVVGSFSIENRSGLRPTTAGRTLDVSAGGEAGLDWANIGGPTTTQTLSGTTVKNATDVKTDTAAILMDTGTDGVVVNTFTTAGKAELQAEAADALNTYDPPTSAELDARTLAAASYATSANQTAIIGHLTTGDVGLWATRGLTMIELDGVVYRLTANSLEQGPVTSTSGLALESTSQAILADTNELQTDWTNDGGLDLILDTIATDVSGLDGAAMRGTDSALLAASAPTNFSAMLINVSGHVSRVTLVDTTTANTDMRGTDNALLAASYTAPDNASIAAILVDTAEIGVAGAGLTAIPWNAAWDAEVQSEVNDGLVAFGVSTLTIAQVNLEVDTALAEIRLDELLVADSDIDGLTPPAVGSVFFELLTKTAASFTYDQATDSLEAIRDRGDSAWTTGAGTSTLTQADVRAAVGLAAANLDTQLGAIDSVVDAILLDTAEIGAAGVGLTAIPWNIAWDGEVESEVVDALTVFGVSTLTAAGIRSAIGLASANLDTQILTIPAAILDLADGIETGWTLREAQRVQLAAVAGKSSGHSSNAPIYRDVNDTKNRITATSTADGRTAVTYDKS